MKVLVTGSSGFIGQNLLAALGDRGVPFDFVNGQDTLMLSQVVRALEGVDAVVHLAAVTGVELSINEPEASILNIMMVQTVLDACRKTGAAFFMASTAGALSGAPRSPYAASKLAGEAYCSAYAYSYRLRTTVLRFGNVYGPGSGDKKTAIASACRALATDTPFRLYGDGSQRRDFIYVGDLCRGIVQAVDAEVEGQFNLSSGKLERLDTVIETLAKVSGRRLRIDRQEGRKGEAEPTRIDIRPAMCEFGFNPETTLNKGLRQTWEWFRTVA
jgi:UDP-glucose 4-epimerase